MDIKDAPIQTAGELAAYLRGGDFEEFQIPNPAYGFAASTSAEDRAATAARYRKIAAAFFAPETDEMLDIEELSDEKWDDNCGNEIYRFGETFLHFDGSNNMHAAKADGIADYLGGWDWDAYGSREDLLASFGVDPQVAEAPADHPGECRIWVEPKYYAGTLGAPTPGFLRDGRGDITLFDTRAEAEAWVASQNEGRYYLAHGEYARPEYTIATA